MVNPEPVVNEPVVPDAPAPIVKKTWGAIVAGLVLGLVAAISNEVADPTNAEVLESVNPILRFVLISLIPLIPGVVSYFMPPTARVDAAMKKEYAKKGVLLVNKDGSSWTRGPRR
jgi:hypothetical protein